MSSRKHSGAANFGGRLPPDVVGGLASKQPRSLRIDPETSARAEIRPLYFTTRTSSPKFSSRTHKDANTTRVDARQDAAHRDTSRHRRAIASRGSRDKGSPLQIRSSQGSLA